jgi:Mlc titration factor MtfA (ptsG expression regulator)
MNLLVFFGVPALIIFLYVFSVGMEKLSNGRLHGLFAGGLSAGEERFLLQNIPYYRELSNHEKNIFRSRMKRFIKGKNFETRQGLKLTKEMILLISASAIKITFGLKDYMFNSFHTFIIYPGEFYSRFSKKLSKGETNARGVIVFSWDDLKFGYQYPDDSLNLGYHEFAHALFIEHFTEIKDDEFSRNYVRWLAFIKNKHKLNYVKQHHIFRDYAAVNEQEFFAVALENFFERPKQFREQLPHLYLLMSKMLNQDLLKPAL